MNPQKRGPSITCRWLTCFEHLTRHSQTIVVEFGINWPALEEFHKGSCAVEQDSFPRCVMGALLFSLVELWVSYALNHEVLPASHLPPIPQFFRT